MNTMQLLLPNEKIKRCFFHLSPNIWKHIESADSTDFLLVFFQQCKEVLNIFCVVNFENLCMMAIFATLIIALM